MLFRCSHHILFHFTNNRSFFTLDNSHKPPKIFAILIERRFAAFKARVKSNMVLKARTFLSTHPARCIGENASKQLQCFAHIVQ
jgi:hypothetical protein